MYLISSLIFSLPFVIGLVFFVIFLAIFGRVRNNLFTILIVATIMTMGVLAALFSGRDLSSELDAQTMYEVGGQGGFWLLLQRGVNGLVLAGTVAYIFANLPDGSRRPKLNSILLFFVLYFLTNYILSGIFGIFPTFDYRWLYAFLLTSAYCYAPDTSPDTFLRICLIGMVSTLVVSLLAIVAVPQVALQSNYKEAVFAWLEIRLWGLTSHPNSLGPAAGFVIIALVIRPMLGWLRIPAIVIATACLILAQSKTAILATVVILIAYWIPKLLRIIGLAFSSAASGRDVSRGLGALLSLSCGVILAAVLFALAGNGLVDLGADINTKGFSTFTGRSLIWEITLQKWRENIAFGYGPDLWSVAFRSKAGMMFAGQAHNQWVQTLGQSGIVGAIGLGLYVVALCTYAIKHHRASNGLSSALVAFLMLQTFSETPFRITNLFDLAFFKHFIVVAYLASLDRVQSDADARVDARLVRA